MPRWSLINSRNKRCPCSHGGRGSEPEGFATAHRQGAHEPEYRIVEADINIATLCFWLFLVSLHSTLSFEMRTPTDFLHQLLDRDVAINQVRGGNPDQKGSSHTEPFLT